MYWILIILGIVAYIYFVGNAVKDKEIKKRNKEFGGLKNVFFEWTSFLERNKFELYKETKDELLFKTNYFEPLEVHFRIHSGFVNIIESWVVHPNGERLKSKKFQIFDQNLETISDIFDKTMDNLNHKNALYPCLFGHDWEYDSETHRFCKRCHRFSSYDIVSGTWYDV